MIVYALCRWNERWKVLGGVVHCRRCRNSQAETDRASRFEHIAGCLYDQYDSPWLDLDSIAERIQLRCPDTGLPGQMLAPSHIAYPR